MAQQLTQLISALLGDAQSQSPLTLQNAYSPGGSLNLYIDKLGQIRSVDGWTRQNAAAFTTDTGGSAARIRNLYQFKKLAAGVVTRQLMMILDDAVNECELHYSTDLGATKTFVTDFGAGSINTIFDCCTFGDQMFLTNGVISPRMWDGAALTTAGGTQLAAPTLADGGAGPLNGNGYKYKVVPIQANKVRKIGSVASASLQVQNRRITVTWTADTDVTVVGYEIWRTTGSGLDYYLVAYIDGRATVSYTDNMPDSTLITRDVMAVVASNGDAPPSGSYFCVPHKGRVWWGRTDTYPRRWWISDPGDPDSVYTELSYTETTDAQSLGDYATGGTGEFEGMIVLWCRNSVWVVSGTGTIVGNARDWRKRRTNAKTGTVWHRTVARVGVGASYIDQDGKLQKTRQNLLAYLTPERDIRFFDGDNDTIVSFPKTDTLKRLNVANAHKSYVYDDTQHGMLVWVFPIDNATEPNYSVAWNYWYGTWHEWDGTNFGHVCNAESATENDVLLAGEARTATGALIYRLWSGSDRDGVDITATFLSMPIYPPMFDGGPPDLTREKRLDQLILLFKKDATPETLSVGFLPPDADDSDAPDFVKTVTGSSRVKVAARQGATDPNPGKFHFGVGWRLKISSTGHTSSWILQGIQQIYYLLAGTTR